MSNLIKEAKEAANEIFLNWCKSTLRETACVFLKRKMAIKHKEELKSLRQNDDNDDSQLQILINDDDIQDVYNSTERVGRKWIDRLIQDGEDDFAGVVDHVCGMGKFLEVEEIDNGGELGWKNPCEINHKVGEDELNVLPGAGTHIPPQPSPKMIPYPLTDHRSEWLRNQISSIESTSNSWPYDWSIIQQAATNVTTRLHSTLQNYRNPKLEVIPKVLVQEDTNESIIAASSSLSSLVHRKRRREIRSSNTNDHSSHHTITARPPCNQLQTGHVILLRDDITKEMQQRTHDPDFNQFLHDNEKQQIQHTIQGALKPIGAIHIWEQYKSDSTFQPKSINRIIKSRKDLSPEQTKNYAQRIQTKARKERLRLSCSKSFQRKVVSAKKYTSKIERVVASNDHASSDGHEWMQFDLGECFLQLQGDDGVGNKRQKKDWLAFRSVEALLLD